MEHHLREAYNHEKAEAHYKKKAKEESAGKSRDPNATLEARRRMNPGFQRKFGNSKP